MNETVKMTASQVTAQADAKSIIMDVYSALEEKGYNSVIQLAGYLISGDPGYITNHKNARGVIRRMERDELLEELIRSYVEKYR